MTPPLHLLFGCRCYVHETNLCIHRYHLCIFESGTLMLNATVVLLRQWFTLLEALRPSIVWRRCRWRPRSCVRPPTCLLTHWVTGSLADSPTHPLTHSHYSRSLCSVSTTNESAILRIDVSATDVYATPAPPLLLYYNPSLVDTVWVAVESPDCEVASPSRDLYDLAQPVSSKDGNNNGSDGSRGRLLASGVDCSPGGTAVVMLKPDSVALVSLAPTTVGAKAAAIAPKTVVAKR